MEDYVLVLAALCLLIPVVIIIILWDVLETYVYYIDFIETEVNQYM